MPGGNVNITVVDGGSASIIVAGSSVQLAIGCCSGGVANQIIATRTASTLQNSLGYGPLVEAAAQAVLAGGTVLAMKVPSNTPGALNLVAYGGGVIVGSTNANPSVCTTTNPHTLATGQVLAIVGSVTNTAINSTWQITSTGASTFSVPILATGIGTGGTVTALSGFMGSLSSSPGNGAIWVTGVPLDTYFVQVKIITGGSTTVAGITFQLSLDAGRNYGPVIVLGVATTYVVPNTGITINFLAAAPNAFASGDFMTAGTTEPYWSTAGIQAALNAFQASQYAIQGVGSIHIVGTPGYTTTSGASCATIQGYLDTLANGYVYTRSFMSARDASPAVKWGGTGETEAAWMTSIQTDYSATAARRFSVAGGNWNIPSAFPAPSTYGAPRYRRSIAFAAASRQVTVPPQRHIGRVKDGNLTQIVVDQINDPNDGFVYHDERVSPGNDYLIAGAGGRFLSSLTRIGYPGVFISNPLTMAPLGSDFFLMPLGLVMDVFSSIMRQSSQLIIDDDVRLNPNGTIYENDARAIENKLASYVNAAMFSQKMISQPVIAGPTASAAGAAIIVDRTINVKSLNQINISGQIIARGYVLTVNETLSFQNPNAAV